MDAWSRGMWKLAEGFRPEWFSRRLLRELKHQAVGILYLDVVEFRRIEAEYGRKTCNDILRRIEATVSSLGLEDQMILSCRRFGDDFIVLTRLPKEGLDTNFQKTLCEQALMVRDRVEKNLQQGVLRGIETIRIECGTSVIQYGSNDQIERLLYDGIKLALKDAKRGQDLVRKLHMTEFRQILSERSVTSRFQPIVDVETGEVHGYEALTRGPQNSRFHSPLELFQMAEEASSLVELEQAACASAVAGFASQRRMVHKLFLNVNSKAINDANLMSTHITELSERLGVVPQDVVLEITERHNVEDMAAFTRLLEHYRHRGHLIAVDDAGAGYSSLQLIAELRPDYIKIDRSLVHNIDGERDKQILLETLVQLAERIHCKVIAEGIETPQEFHRVAELGAHFVQGFLFGRPEQEMSGVPVDLSNLFHRTRRKSPEKDPNTLRIRDVVSRTRSFEEDTPVSGVVRYFEDHELETGIVVTRGDYPVGLVMKQRLFQRLATPYGVSLYSQRGIEKLMDVHPLIVDAQASLDSVSRLAMRRDPDHLYDLVIVTEGGKFFGTVTIQKMLDVITDQQVEWARDANPLTGLPGNARIKRELAKRIQGDEDFSVVYADLDSFKWFNDAYGFQSGDEVIRFLGTVLADAAPESSEWFVGHIGGDDFIVVTNAKDAAPVCEAIIKRFEEGMGALYPELTSATSESVPPPNRDRSGRVVSTQGVSISLSLLECPRRGLSALSLERLAQEASVLKKQAKSQSGSALVHAVSRA